MADILVDGDKYSEKLETAFNKAVKKVSEDIEGLKMNTAIATLMALLNDISAAGKINRAEFRTFLILLNPFAPHISEELWVCCGYEGMLNKASWPTFDESKCVESTVEIVAQINGKIKARLSIPADISSEDAIELVKKETAIAAEIDGKTVVKELYVPKKLVNIVVR